jgi:hypothetical protein
LAEILEQLKVVYSCIDPIINGVEGTGSDKSNPPKRNSNLSNTNKPSAGAIGVLGSDLPEPGKISRQSQAEGIPAARDVINVSRLGSAEPECPRPNETIAGSLEELATELRDVDTASSDRFVEKAQASAYAISISENPGTTTFASALDSVPPTMPTVLEDRPEGLGPDSRGVSGKRSARVRE